jgi:NADH-quinone oxidoreductase subunit B
LLQGLLLLQDAIRHEDRPLSWMINPDGSVDKPDMPAQRDVRTPERIKATNLRSPDEV